VTTPPPPPELEPPDPLELDPELLERLPPFPPNLFLAIELASFRTKLTIPSAVL